MNKLLSIYIIAFNSLWLSGVTFGAEKSIQYRYAFVSGHGDQAKQTCELSRKSFGDSFKQKYKLDNVLTSCEKYTENSQKQWAVIFAFEADHQDLDIPLDFNSTTIESPVKYTVEIPHTETRVKSVLTWNGSKWIPAEETYNVTIIKTEIRTFTFSDQVECQALAQRLLTGDESILVKGVVIGAHCSYSSETEQWKVDVLSNCGNHESCFDFENK